MGMLVCMGAMLQCSFGAAPSSMIVLPLNMVNSMMPCANIMDNKPLVNIMPFGVCSSMTNPLVAAATAAAMGVLTPVPCIPVTVAPWAPGSPTVLIGKMPALNNSSKLVCAYGGMIQISSPGQMKVNIP